MTTPSAQVAQRGPSKTALVWARDRAERELDQQIARGEALLAMPLATADDLARFEDAHRQWHSYNHELTSQMVSDQSFSRYYGDQTGTRMFVTSFAERAKVMRERATRQVSRLWALRGKLSLLPDAALVPTVHALDERTFDFITNPALRAVVRADYLEAQRASAAEAYKAAAILLAGVLEGMVEHVLSLPSVQARADYGQAVRKLTNGAATINWRRASLAALVDALQNLNLLTTSRAGLVRNMADFRDTVHPHNEAETGNRARREEAQALLNLVPLLYRDLSTIT